MATVKPIDPRLLRYAKAARRYIISTAAIGLATAALVIIQAFLISGAASPVIEAMMPDGAGLASPGPMTVLRDVLPLIGLIAVVVLARAGLVYLREATAHNAAHQTIAELRDLVMAKALRLGPRWRARRGAETTTLVTRGLDDLEPYFVKFLPQLLLAVTVTPLTLIALCMQDILSAGIALVVIPLIPLFMILIGRFTQDATSKRLASFERLASQLLDLMAGLPTLRALGQEKSPREHLRNLSSQSTNATLATLRVAFLSGAVLEFLTTLCVALVAVEVGMRLVSGDISLYTGLIVIMLAPEVFDPIRHVGTQFHASANGVQAAQEVFDILEVDETPHGTSPAPSLATSTITLDDLSVAARGVWAPASLTAQIRPGRVTALVGPSGVGKSTTAMCLLALESPTRGRILIGEDGVDLADVDPASWWTQVTWVPQTPTILPGTVRANVSLEASTERLGQAALATGFQEVVDDLPQGWDSEIGQGGVGLSVGQRQRLALTRALLDDSALVVLDEPTAHLDAATEEQVVATIDSLKAQGRTVVVIAHRPAVVAAADDVIDVQSRGATPQEHEQYPALGEVEELADLSVRLPGLLDEEEAEG